MTAPIIRDQNWIVANRYMLPYGSMGVVPANIPAAPATPTSNMTTYMSTTGERWDLGLVNEYTARWLMGLDAPDSMLNWADVDLPVEIMGPDGKPYDILANPKASINPNQGPPVLTPLPPGVWELDIAHWPETFYGAYLATGLVKYLAKLQFTAIYGILEDNYWAGVAGFAVVSIGQTRLEAWALRNLAYARVATELAESLGQLPANLQPSSYFKTLLDNQLSWLTKSYMQDPALQLFRCFPYHTKPGWWQADYLNHVLAFMAMRFVEWRPLYLWTLGNAIARTNGKSGFPPALATWYYGPLGPKTDTDQDLNVVPHSRPASDYFQTWGEVFDNFAINQINKTAVDKVDFTQADYDALKADQYNGGKFSRVTDGNYATFIRGVLADAVWLDRNKIVSVSTEYPDLEQCYAVIDGMVKTRGYMSARWSISVTPQPIQPQPPTEIDMPDTYSIETGKHGFIPVTPNGTLSSGPDYSTDNPAVIANVSAGTGGVNFDSVAEGVANIIATAQGATSISKSVQVTVTAPLPTATATDLSFGDLVVS